MMRKDLSINDKEIIIDNCTPLVRWSLYKYKCLWSIGGKGRGSSLQKRASHTYTLRLGYNRNSILYNNNNNDSNNNQLQYVIVSFNFLPSLSNQNALKSNYSSTNKNIDDLTILKKVQIYGIDTLSRVQ